LILLCLVFQPQLHIENRNDYVLELSIGKIQAMFTSFFASVERRQLNEEEFAEVNRVIFNRTADIRKAIFDTG
jgi:hypothetical protein